VLAYDAARHAAFKNKKKALIMLGLFLVERSCDRNDLALLRQEAALAGQVAIKLEVRADNDGLVGSDPDTERHVSNAIESWTACRRYDPIEVPRVRWQESYRACARFTGIGSGGSRSRNGYAGQIGTISVENIDGDVGGSSAAVENVKIRP
jgi:hypothetical protein